MFARNCSKNSHGRAAPRTETRSEGVDAADDATSVTPDAVPARGRATGWRAGAVPCPLPIFSQLTTLMVCAHTEKSCEHERKYEPVRFFLVVVARRKSAETEATDRGMATRETMERVAFLSAQAQSPFCSKPVRDFGTDRALVEPLGPNTGNFPNSSTQNGH